MKIYPCGAGTVHTLERYLVSSGLIVDGRQTTATSQTATVTEEYTNHLREVRGFAASTVSSHRRTAQCFLQHLKEAGTAVGCIRASNIESYIAKHAPDPGKSPARYRRAARIPPLSYHGRQGARRA